MKLTPEQIEFKDLLHRFFQEKVTPEYRRARIALEAASDSGLRQEIDGLGVFQGFCDTPPMFSVEELGILASECGYALVTEAVVDQLIATGVTPHLLSEAERASLSTITLSKTGQGTTGTIAYPSCCALDINQDEKTASGSIYWAAGLASASWCLAFAATSSGRRLVAFSLSAPGVTVRKKTSIDLTVELHEVELRDTQIMVCAERSALVLEDLIEAVKACEISGVCKRALEMSVEYAKTRQQFGMPIGSFQAIQQKLADCYAKSEALASLSSFATWSAAHSPEQRRITARAAILEASRSGPAICEAAIQAHGGIGFTWEYDLHLYLRRAKLVEAAFAITESRADELLGAIESATG